jgi:hypothetical protein
MAGLVNLDGFMAPIATRNVSKSYGPVALVLSTTTRPNLITQRMFSLLETAADVG